MVKLPDWTSIDRPTVQNPGRQIHTYSIGDATEGIKEWGNSFDKIAEGAKALGRGIAQAAGDFEAQQGKESAFHVANAKSDYLVGSTKLDAERQKITDPAKLTEYAPKYQGVLERSAQQILDPEERRKFLTTFAPAVAEQNAQVQTQDFKLKRDAYRYSSDEKLAALRQTALAAPDQKTSDAAIAAATEMYNTGADAGYYTREEAGDHRRRWVEKYAFDKVSTMSPEDRLTAAGEPLPGAAPSHAPGGTEGAPSVMVGGGSTRADKNLNPGNIGYGAFARSQGSTGAAGTDTGHGVAVFPSAEAGWSAMETLARNKFNAGKRTADQLIADPGGWTPGNHQAAANIARGMGLGPHDDLQLDKPERMRQFKIALATQEGAPGLVKGFEGGGTSPGQQKAPSSPQHTHTPGPVLTPESVKGRANAAHGQWGQPGENLIDVKLNSGAKFTVNKQAATAFNGFFNALEERLGYRITDISGFQHRNKKDGNTLSQHAYGNAVDVNGGKNLFSNKLVTDLPPGVSKLAAEFGISWGGDWKGKKDAMHFEYVGDVGKPEGPAPSAGGASPAPTPGTGLAPTPGTGLAPRSQLFQYIPEDKRQDIVRGAHEEIKRRDQESAHLRREETQTLTVLKESDKQSIMETGKPVSTISPERIAALEGPEAGRRFQDERAAQSAYHFATKGIQGKTESEVDAAVESLKPPDGDELFKSKNELYTKARKDADEMLKLRREDPAAAMDKMPALKEQVKEADINNPSSMIALANGRMAMQAHLGIPENRRSPITKAEGDQLWRPVVEAEDRDKNEVIGTFIETLKAAYGAQYAEKAFNQIMRNEHVKPELRGQAFSILNKLANGERLTRHDGRALDAAKTRDTANTAIGNIAPSKPPVREDHRKRLMANPTDEEQRLFDGAYGEGAARAALKR